MKALCKVSNRAGYFVQEFIVLSCNLKIFYLSFYLLLIIVTHSVSQVMRERERDFAILLKGSYKNEVFMLVKSFQASYLSNRITESFNNLNFFLFPLQCGHWRYILCV